MGKKLYVGNLSFNMDEQSLGNLFSSIGTVESAKIITDRDSGRSKGFAFIEMSSDAEAQSAIEKLNGSTQMDRQMTVSEAKPQTDKPRGGGFRSNFGGGGNRSRY